ncbi:hypothetical protein PPL_00131 [Heterostelium album PN500]|uniref:Ubiquitin-like domain-containing protein n=1 Tax=Heterostelium pallidum (strain ATCC 26659 / Pp 5 / PN500) TaxID=670386 RepID=D3AVL6_HETP5|nr:hypothetical protein PPL_00131 [Heterostelium album PN500]EFA86339.1 hypothetical protein PPL_00131 [Heterostelium album PN500]|eukprot:XP_020438444.1 hypothetical protein PPL_00131 [Heterostelium album PN500]
MKVQCPSGETIEIIVSQDDSILDIKEKIHNETGTPSEHQLIKIGGKKTLSKRKDKKKISCFDLDNNSSVCVY